MQHNFLNTAELTTYRGIVNDGGCLNLLSSKLRNNDNSNVF